MLEQEFFNGRQAIEFSPREVKLWCGMKPVDFTDCDRVVIKSGTIEFQRDRESYLFCLDEEPHSVSLLRPVPFEDRRINTPI